MPRRPSMAALLLGARLQADLDALHATESVAHRASAEGLAKRQENAARLACRPDPSPIETSTRNPPNGKKA